MAKFKLDDQFIKGFDGKEPIWGKLGWFTYKRTYARQVGKHKEEWTDTVRRVVEGLASISPDRTVTQKRMQRLYTLIWNLDITPPGRGLWMLGTDFAEKNGDALNNCWFVDSRPYHYGTSNKIFTRYSIDPNKSYPSYPYVFLFDMSMKGGGVGHSNTQDNMDLFPTMTNPVKVDIAIDVTHPNFDEIKNLSEQLGFTLVGTFGWEPDSAKGYDLYHRIPDTREGWAEAYAIMIDNHYFHGSGKPVSILFDMSEIRERDRLIKGFGGKASGPAPLAELLYQCNKYVWDKVYYAHGGRMTSILSGDCHNMTGRAVVAGNVRRTAEVDLFGPDDKACIEKKDYKLVTHVNKGWTEDWKPILKSVDELVLEGYSQEQAEKDWYTAWSQNNHRWTSNNSIIIDDPQNYDFGFISPNIESNGEPGIFNRFLAQNYGRIVDGFKKLIDNCRGGNPCFRGDMRLLTSEGYKTFEGLEGQQVIVINKDGTPSHGKVWCSGEKPTVQIRFTDKRTIICTEDHVFMLAEGTECQAKDLKGKQIMPFLSQPTVFDLPFVQMGFMQGDGQLSRLKSATHKGVEVGIGKDDRLDILPLFRLTEEDFLNDRKQVYITDHTEIMKALGFSAEHLPYRVMPSTFDSWAKEQKISFLRGMYSANGSVIRAKTGASIKSRVSYKTTCRELAEQLKNILQNEFSWNAYITTNKSRKNTFGNGEYVMKESYDINIANHKDQAEFYNTIGFEQVYKTEKLHSLLMANAPKVQAVTSTGKVEKVYDFSEPLLHWGVVEGLVVHNCMEIPLFSGEPCNLFEVHLPKVLEHSEAFLEETGEDLLKVCLEFATWATKRVTLQDYEWELSREVIGQNRRLGVSLAGIQDWVLLKFGPGITGWVLYGKYNSQASYHDNLPEYDPETQFVEPVYNDDLIEALDTMYKTVIAYDIEYSAILTEDLGYEIKPSIKRTTTKPGGTVPLLSGVTPGMHFAYFDYGIRRITVSDTDPLLKLAQQCGLKTEVAAQSPNAWKVEFPYKAASADIEGFMDATAPIECQFAYQSLLQMYWADNMVSCTITFQEQEKPKIRHLLEQYSDRIKSTSLLPYSGHGYVQAPYEPFPGTREERLAEYERREKEIKIQPHELYHMMKALGNFGEESEELTIDSQECAGGGCPTK